MAGRQSRGRSSRLTGLVAWFYVFLILLGSPGVAALQQRYLESQRLEPSLPDVPDAASSPSSSSQHRFAVAEAQTGVDPITGVTIAGAVVLFSTIAIMIESRRTKRLQKWADRRNKQARDMEEIVGGVVDDVRGIQQVLTSLTGDVDKKIKKLVIEIALYLLDDKTSTSASNEAVLSTANLVDIGCRITRTATTSGRRLSDDLAAMAQGVKLSKMCNAEGKADLASLGNNNGPQAAAKIANSVRDALYRALLTEELRGFGALQPQRLNELLNKGSVSVKIESVKETIKNLYVKRSVEEMRSSASRDENEITRLTELIEAKKQTLQELRKRENSYWNRRAVSSGPKMTALEALGAVSPSLQTLATLLGPDSESDNHQVGLGRSDSGGIVAAALADAHAQDQQQQQQQQQQRQQNQYIMEEESKEGDGDHRNHPLIEIQEELSSEADGDDDGTLSPQPNDNAGLAALLTGAIAALPTGEAMSPHRAPAANAIVQGQAVQALKQGAIAEQSSWSSSRMLFNYLGHNVKFLGALSLLSVQTSSTVEASSMVSLATLAARSMPAVLSLLTLLRTTKEYMFTDVKAHNLAHYETAKESGLLFEALANQHTLSSLAVCRLSGVLRGLLRASLAKIEPLASGKHQLTGEGASIVTKLLGLGHFSLPDAVQIKIVRTFFVRLCGVLHDMYERASALFDSDRDAFCLASDEMKPLIDEDDKMWTEAKLLSKSKDDHFDVLSAARQRSSGNVLIAEGGGSNSALIVPGEASTGRASRSDRSAIGRTRAERAMQLLAEFSAQIKAALAAPAPGTDAHGGFDQLMNANRANGELNNQKRTTIRRGGTNALSAPLPEQPAQPLLQPAQGLERAGSVVSNGNGNGNGKNNNLSPNLARFASSSSSSSTGADADADPVEKSSADATKVDKTLAKAYSVATETAASGMVSRSTCVPYEGSISADDIYDVRLARESEVAAWLAVGYERVSMPDDYVNAIRTKPDIFSVASGELSGLIESGSWARRALTSKGVVMADKVKDKKSRVIVILRCKALPDVDDWKHDRSPHLHDDVKKERRKSQALMRHIASLKAPIDDVAFVQRKVNAAPVLRPGMEQLLASLKENTVEGKFPLAVSSQELNLLQAGYEPVRMLKIGETSKFMADEEPFAFPSVASGAAEADVGSQHQHQPVLTEANTVLEATNTGRGGKKVVQKEEWAKTRFFLYVLKGGFAPLKHLTLIPFQRAQFFQDSVTIVGIAETQLLMDNEAWGGLLRSRREAFYEEERKTLKRQEAELKAAAEAAKVEAAKAKAKEEKEAKAAKKAAKEAAKGGAGREQLIAEASSEAPAIADAAVAAAAEADEMPVLPTYKMREFDATRARIALAGQRTVHDVLEIGPGRSPSPLIARNPGDVFAPPGCILIDQPVATSQMARAEVPVKNKNTAKNHDKLSTQTLLHAFQIRCPSMPASQRWSRISPSPYGDLWNAGSLTGALTMPYLWALRRLPVGGMRDEGRFQLTSPCPDYVTLALENQVLTTARHHRLPELRLQFQQLKSDATQAKQELQQTKDQAHAEIRTAREEAMEALKAKAQAEAQAQQAQTQAQQAQAQAQHAQAQAHQAQAQAQQAKMQAEAEKNRSWLRLRK